MPKDTVTCLHKLEGWSVMVVAILFEYYEQTRPMSHDPKDRLLLSNFEINTALPDISRDIMLLCLWRTQDVTHLLSKVSIYMRAVKILAAYISVVSRASRAFAKTTLSQLSSN